MPGGHWWRDDENIPDPDVSETVQKENYIEEDND